MPRSMESGKDEGLQRMGDGKSKDGGSKKKKINKKRSGAQLPTDDVLAHRYYPVISLIMPQRVCN